MPLKLIKAPSTFIRSMNVISDPWKWQIVLIYLMDVTIFPKRRRTVSPSSSECSSSYRNQENFETESLPLLHQYSYTYTYFGHVIWLRELKIALHTTNTIRPLKNHVMWHDYDWHLDIETCSYHSSVHLPEYRHCATVDFKAICEIDSIFFNKEKRPAIGILEKPSISGPIEMLPFVGGHCTFETELRDVQIGSRTLQKLPHETEKHLNVCLFFIRKIRRWEIKGSENDS